MGATNFIKDIRDAVYTVFANNVNMLAFGGVIEKAYMDPLPDQMMTAATPYFGVFCVGWDPDNMQVVGETCQKVLFSCGICVEGPGPADQIALQDEAAQMAAQADQVIQNEILTSMFSLANSEGAISYSGTGRFRFLPSPAANKENQDTFRVFAKYDFVIEYRRNMSS